MNWKDPKMSPVVPKSSQAVSRSKRKRDTSPDSADTSSSSSEPEQTGDAPVLSHAARRKQKKQAALLKEAVPHKTPNKKQKKEEEGSSSIKRQNSVWVGNLCYKTTSESLRRFFDGVGEITRVHLPTKLGNASTGEPARRENRGCVFF
jgi:RNA recognition motif-containing protein